MKKLLFPFVFLGIFSCTSVPSNISPVAPFFLEEYLGTWYEVARLDHSFERGLERVTATYSLRDDGGVDVVNRGVETGTGEWSEARGKAYFVGSDGVGHLKVSFFGPFYASYVVFELDRDYRYAFVTSSSLSYLWLLSRTPEVDEAVKQRFVERAASLGVDTETLIWVNHD